MKMHTVMALAIAGVFSHAAFASDDVADAKPQLEPQPAAASAQPPIVITGPKASQQRPDPTVDLGSPGDPDTVSRIVRLGSSTSYASVNYGQDVEFVATGPDGKQRSFAWRFNVWPNTDMMYLNKVAPAGFIDHQVRIYIGADPERFGA
jgi:hypothetical protein